MLVRQTDAAGNTQAMSSAFTFTLASINSLSNVTVDLKSTSDTGSSSTDNLTNDTTPTFSVNLTGKTNLSAGQVIEIVNGSTVVASYTIQAGDLAAGAWNVGVIDITDGNPITAGDYSFKARINDGGSYGAASDVPLLVTVDTTAPTITAVTIPNAAMNVGDVVTATITVSGATGETLTLSSGTVGGFTLGNLTKTNDTTYTATFTVTEGGTDVGAGSSIPVSVQFNPDAAGNVSNTYTTAISQNADAIDANSPTITAVAYNSSTNVLTITGTDFTNATFDPNQITWDIDGQSSVNPDYTFPGGSAVSILSSTSATITLSSDALEASTGFAGTLEDNLDFSAAFITDLAGNTSALTSNLQIALSLYGTDNADNLFGGSLADLLSGGYGTDELRGNGGNDTLIGGGSNDTVIGGAGADTYVFADTLIGDGSVAGDAAAFAGVNTSVGVDTINFVAADNDRFRLDEAVFGEMGNAGTLASNQFLSVASSSTALTGLNTTGHGAIAYDSTLNKLYFVQAETDTNETLDALVVDGFAVQIATISGNDIASASSFFIV